MDALVELRRQQEQGRRMQQRLMIRRDRVTIPGLTDVILSRLRDPFALIAEWTRYVPLEGLLRLSDMATLRYDRDYSSGVTILISAELPNLCIPTPLHERTDHYLEQTIELRRNLYCIRLFVTAQGAVTTKDVFDAIASALLN